MTIIKDLASLEQESIARGIPILGREKGTWLWKKIKEVKPKPVLELGTANGYSGIILGSSGVDLTTIEINEKIAEEAMRNFLEHNVNAQVLLGDAIAITNELAQNKKE